ncbi:hypothetical protein PMAYCL1PPCAC_22522, partial [Pristionchus mayeri]
TASSTANTVSLAITWLTGDFFQRKKLFLTSVSIWIMCSLLSVLLGSHSFLIFVSFRSLSSSATAVLGVLAPVMLAEIFEDRALGIALMCASASDFLSTTVTGIFSSWILGSGFPWQSGLIAGPLMAIIPAFGILCSSLIFRKANICAQKWTIGRSFINAFGIFSIKSYTLLIIGMALGMFNFNSMMFWSPTMILNAWTAYPDSFVGLSYTAVMSLNSLAQMVGSLIGLPSFLWFAQ